MISPFRRDDGVCVEPASPGTTAAVADSPQHLKD